MNTESLQDYQIAAQELAALWASLGLTAEITGAHAAVDEDSGEKGWAHVAVTVTIARPLVIGKHKEARASFDWKMGTGLVKWADIAKRAKYSRGPTAQREAEEMARYGSRLSAKDQARIAGQHLSAFVKAVNPAEVLARCCADGLEASGTSFDDWASNLGYDTDSRKAEAIYLACQESGTKARKLVDGATFTKLAELANRL